MTHMGQNTYLFAFRESIFQTLPYRRYSTSYGILLERNKTPVTVVRGLYLSEDAAHTSPVQGCPCPEVIIESPHQIARHLPRHPYTTYPRAAADVTPAEFGHLRSRPGAALSSTEFGHLRSRPGAALSSTIILKAGHKVGRE